MAGTTKDVKLELKITGVIHDYTVRIDDKKITLTNGKATVKKDSGVHGLIYIFVGVPGTVVKISITAPDEAKWEREFTLSDDGVYVGSKKFYINQS